MTDAPGLNSGVSSDHGKKTCFSPRRGPGPDRNELPRAFRCHRPDPRQTRATMSEDGVESDSPPVKIVTGKETRRRSTFVVIVTEVIVAVTRPNPKVPECATEIDDDARPIPDASSIVPEVTRREKRSTIFPTVIPVARHEVTTVGRDGIIVGDPNPTLLASRPEPRSPNVPLLLSFPAAGNPKVIL